MLLQLILINCGIQQANIKQGGEITALNIYLHMVLPNMGNHLRDKNGDFLPVIYTSSGDSQFVTTAVCTQSFPQYFPSNNLPY